MKNLNNLKVEKKRIRWSNINKTTRTFISTVIFIVVFSIIIFLFSWGIESLLNLIK